VKQVFTVILVGVLFLGGCRSAKDYYDRKGQLKNITDAKLINSIEDEYVEYNTLFFKKFKAEVEFNGEKKSFKGNLFVDKDSAVIVSIFPLMGIELLRVKLSPDKVEIIDRTKKVYTLGDYELLWDKFLIDVNYEMIQRILTDELYTYPYSYPEDGYIKRYKHYNTDSIYQLKSIKKGRYNRLNKRDNTQGLVMHEFSVLPEIFKIAGTYIKDYGLNTEVKIKYEKFLNVNGYFLPSLFKLNGSRGQTKFAMKIIFEKIDIDGENSIGFKVSSKYKVNDLRTNE
jgi:hypothetical protein